MSEDEGALLKAKVLRLYARLALVSQGLYYSAIADKYQFLERPHLRKLHAKWARLALRA